MELLFFFEEGIVLSQTLKSQLLSNLDVLGLRNVALLELADLHRVGR